ncbi:phosphate ABC transporter permease PstA [Vibrio amylolyticus]
MLKWMKSGSPWIWLTGGAVSISLLSVMGLMLLIGWKGLSYFWPAPLYQWKTLDGDALVGQLYAQEFVPASRLQAMNFALPSEKSADDLVARYSIKVANRELYPADFVSILDINIKEQSLPKGWAVIERTRNGDFYGKPVGYQNETDVISKDLSEAFTLGLSETEKLREQIRLVIETEFKAASRALESMRLEKRKREINGNLNGTFLQEYDLRKQELNQKLVEADERLAKLRVQLNQDKLIVEDMSGQRSAIPLSHILDMWYPNEMTMAEKVSHWGKQAWKFLSENPRESNSEGGVFPAIFGTVLMVIIMSIVVMPLGVVAAVYLHEYASNNAFTRVIRVAVINLAGVPSIVYGVFGLGFFVYTLGGSMDSLFYAERLPAPTFGTPGLLWSALTLAVLTLPVVIVSAEEGLTRIPSSVRHGSLALGATQFETLWRIVLPMASPAIITGLILAVARAAGEVAPLMLVGVVKLASSLPVDGEFPFLHLDRKFMHLGFHIYDVGFQTTNIEAARPLVYATSFLLITVIISLNLTAISIRNNLREKYRTLGQD